MVRTGLLLLTFCAAVLAGNQILYAQDNDYRIYGVVSDDENSNPVENAEVKLSHTWLDTTLYTGSDGRFEASWTITSADEEPASPVKFQLSNNYPNPFNPSTSVDLNVVEQGNYRIEIFDILGRRLAAKELRIMPGEHTLQLSGLGAAGTYLLRVSGNGVSRTGKMTNIGGTGLLSPGITITSGGEPGGNMAKKSKTTGEYESIRIQVNAPGYQPLSMTIDYSPDELNYEVMPSLKPQMSKERQLSRELSQGESVLSGGSNDFAFRLLQVLQDKEGTDSYFFSPLSITTAFGMALLGARDETYGQLRDFFELHELDRPQIKEAYRDLIHLLTTLDDQVVMNIANSIWHRDDVELLEQFIEENQEYLNAEVRGLDFDDPAAPDTINAWIEDKTEGLIEEMIEEIPPNMILYLINAIYFKGDWTIQFDPDLTGDRAFTRPDGEEVSVPTMLAGDKFRAYQDEDWTALDMWYGDAGYSFTAFMPTNADTTLDDMVGDFTPEKFEEITDNLMERDSLQVYMPKFEIDYKIEGFGNDLQDMGLTIPFGAAADFTRMTGSEDLFISEVMHRAVVEVNEEGSEAAAVTVIAVPTSGGYEPPPEIRLNRPFLFFIRENTTNTILFMGSYTGDEP